MDLFVQVSRDRNGRLNGNVVPKDRVTPRSFSSTLELLKVLEDLVISVSEGEESENEHPYSQATKRRDL